MSTWWVGTYNCLNCNPFVTLIIYQNFMIIIINTIELYTTINNDFNNKYQTEYKTPL